MSEIRNITRRSDYVIEICMTSFILEAVKAGENNVFRSIHSHRH